MKILLRILLVALPLLPTICFGQPGDPGGNPDVPITGIEILVGGGLLFGLRKLLYQKNKNPNKR